MANPLVHEVALEYPSIAPGQVVEIDLVDVRAAAPIRVSYDFARDGWVIAMRQTTEGPGGVSYIDEPETWVEQAFVPAWAAEKEAGS